MWKTRYHNGRIYIKPVDNSVENGNCYKFVIYMLFYCNKRLFGLTNRKKFYIIIICKGISDILKEICMKRQVSASVINRLPRYYRYLGELMKEGCNRISSKALSEKMNITASQIRQDLNCFGGFGQQGYGYNVQNLHDEIGKILGINKKKTAILVGVGNMGRAIVLNTTFEKRGFKLIGIFDSDPEKIGTTLGGYTVADSAEIAGFVKENKPEMAIIAVPKSSVNEVANSLEEMGIRAFLNFSYAELSVKEGVAVENIHLGDSMMRLSYKIEELKEKKKNDF